MLLATGESMAPGTVEMHLVEESVECTILGVEDDKGCVQTAMVTYENLSIQVQFGK